VELHEHAFDHVMFFAVGTATVTAHCPCGDIKTHHVTAGDYLPIPATWKHGVVATSEVVKFHCVFPEYDATGHRGAAFMADTDGA
jgi:mannose-6-phosphate isomerase-like protein (cupin superfamily)